MPPLECERGRPLTTSSWPTQGCLIAPGAQLVGADQSRRKEAQMDTAGNTHPVEHTVAATSASAPRRCRMRRGAFVTAGALTLGLAVASPALSAARAPHAATLQDWQGWSSSQGDPVEQDWGCAATSGSTGASTASQPATAAESAGVALIDTVLPYQHGRAAGSGMVLTSGGQVLTNYHVVHGAGSIRVTIAATGQTYEATVVGTDQADDVALIQLPGASGLTTIRPDT